MTAPHADRDRSDPPNWHEGADTPARGHRSHAAGLEGQSATQEVHDATEAAQGRFEALALLHREWGVQRPAPFEGVIPADGPRSAAEVARNCSASHEGVWQVVSRDVYASPWTTAP